MQIDHTLEFLLSQNKFLEQKIEKLYEFSIDVIGYIGNEGSMSDQYSESIYVLTKIQNAKTKEELEAIRF